MSQIYINAILKLFPVFFLFLSIVQAQEEWIWQNPKPQGNPLNSIQVLDDGTIIVAWLNGTIILSYIYITNRFGTTCATAVYFYQLQATESPDTKKLVITK